MIELCEGILWMSTRMRPERKVQHQGKELVDQPVDDFFQKVLPSCQVSLTTPSIRPPVLSKGTLQQFFSDRGP